MASTAFEQTTDEQLQRIDEILAGPPLVRGDMLVFILPCSALDALRAFEQRLGFIAAENKRVVLMEIRFLSIDGMDLKIRFTTSSDTVRHTVEVSGFKQKNNETRPIFSGIAAYDCYVRFLDGITPAVLEKKAEELRRIDKIVAAPRLVEINNFVFQMPGGSFNALKVMDQRFGKQTVENKKQGRTLTAWRYLNVNGMELRFAFNMHEDDHKFDGVNVFGFRAPAMGVICFSGPSAHDCYVRFLDMVTSSRHHINTVAMGQHARLGSQSLLGVLPKALFRNLMQPLVPTLKHWNHKKEVSLKAAIKQRAFEARVIKIIKIQLCAKRYLARKKLAELKQIISGDMCAICVAPLILGRHTTPCGHFFHTSCIDRWKAIKDTCPMCRQRLT